MEQSGFLRTKRTLVKNHKVPKETIPQGSLSILFNLTYVNSPYLKFSNNNKKKKILSLI